MDRSLVSRATDGSDAPTPGYLYNDIAKNASSSPIAASEIATYLTRRLASKNNPNIKYKCLKVIAKVAVSPITRGQLKRAIAQEATAVTAIKDAISFRGPMDAARGDEYNERVRVAAKEALDAVYSDTPPAEQAAAVSSGMMAASASASGYGVPSSSYGHGPSGATSMSSTGSRTMQGIGNPMYADPRLEVQKGIAGMTVGEVVGVAGETIAAMVKDPLARKVDVPPPRSASGMPGYGGGGYSGPPPGRHQLASATGGEWTMASNRGPGAITAPPNFNADRDATYFKARDSGSNAFSWAQQQGGTSTSTGSSAIAGGVGGSWGNVGGTSGATATTTTTRPSVTVNQHHAAPTGTGGTASSDGTYERNLIMELCPPGGMKAEPPPDKLANFARAVPSLNPDLVCPALLDCLEDGQPWIIRAKALCVMEVAIGVAEQEGGTTGSDDDANASTNAYADFFHACRGEIEPLASHPRAAIRDPAKRVLKSLGIESVEGGVGVGGGVGTGGFRPPKSSLATHSVPVTPNLLDFDDETPAPATAPPVPPPAAAPPTQPPPNDSLFGGLTTKETNAPPTAPPPQPQSTPAQPTPSVPAPTSPAAGGGDMFGDVTVKATPVSAPQVSSTEAVGAAAAAAPPAGGSAFGFMNAPSSNTASMPSTSNEPVTPTPPAKETFDPLLSVGTSSPSSTSVQTTSLTPAQLQQLAYQQMMLQQQQQMQMAYAMQQQQMGRGMPMMAPGGMQSPGTMPMIPQLQQQGGSKRNIMANNAGAAASSPFSFMDDPKKKEEDKQFDFVKDAMKDNK